MTTDVCPDCNHSWEDHEFGVPVPYCPITTEPVPDLNITVTHLATREDPAGTECWVIESHRKPTETTYFAGYFFKDEFEQAVRFVRKCDADKVKSQFSEFKAYFSVKHKWL